MGNKRENQKVVKYYSKIGSRLGYNILLGGAKHYGYYPDKKANLPLREALELHQDLLAQKLRLEPTDQVLDAGCGRGIVAYYLSKNYGCHITGIDLVPFEINKAKLLTENEELKDKLDFQIMDYTYTNFPGNSFDKLYTMETLSHAYDIKQTIREFYRILKPGGKLVCFEFLVAEDSKLTKHQYKMINLFVKYSLSGLKNFHFGQFNQILAKSGFENIEETRLTEYVKPLVKYMHDLAYIPYKVVKLLGIQRLFINLTAAVESYPLVEQGLLQYSIFSATKPK